FRIFDGHGTVVVDTDETSLTTQAGPIADLKRQLAGLQPPHMLTRTEKDRVIAAVTSIAGYTLPCTRPPDLVKPLLDQCLVLDAWKKHTGQPRPKLVLVAVTGGAYRAAFWTAVVLDELVGHDRPRELEKFRDHIRLFTGASGGMVGAAYFV